MIIPLFLVQIQDDKDRELLIDYYHQHRFTMLHVAQSILHDLDLAEDAVQEAFFRLAKNVERIRPDSKQVRSFLATIVKNVSIDLLKQQNVVPMLSLDTMTYEVEDPVSIEELVIQNDDLDAAERLVMSLPIIYSNVFLLKYKHDCSNADISKLLQISEATVRKRLQRSKEKIEEEVQKKKGVGYHE